jgi:hypothetical protein
MCVAQACLLAKPRALPALLHALGGEACDDLKLASIASAALWALLSRSEKAKVVLRGGALLSQLQLAERALAARAAEPPADAAGSPGDEDDLLATLRNLEALGALLDLS